MMSSIPRNIIEKYYRQMSQTALDWLVSELPTIDWSDPYYRTKLEKAKAMEKEQIMDAYWEGGQWVPTHPSSCEEYYNKTFNTTDK